MDGPERLAFKCRDSTSLFWSDFLREYEVLRYQKWIQMTYKSPMADVSEPRPLFPADAKFLALWDLDVASYLQLKAENIGITVEDGFSVHLLTFRLVRALVVALKQWEATESSAVKQKRDYHR